MQPGELQRDGQRHRRRPVNFAEAAPLLCAAGFPERPRHTQREGKRECVPARGRLSGESYTAGQKRRVARQNRQRAVSHTVPAGSCRRGKTTPTQKNHRSFASVFFFGLAFGAPKAMGILSPSGSLKSKSMGLFHCMGAFSPLLPSVRQRQWVLSPLRLAKVQKRGSFSLCGFLPPTFCKQKAALSRRKRRLSAGQINKITSRVQRPAFRSNSSSCWPVARSQAVNIPFSYSI